MARYGLLFRKRRMKNLPLILILSTLTTSTFAGWDDTYLCTTNTLQKVFLDGMLGQFKKQSFEFKIDKVKNALIFHNDDGLIDKKLLTILEADFREQSFDTEVILSDSYPNKTKLKIKEQVTGDHFKLIDDKFIYTSINLGSIDTVIANCSRL